jgi:type 2 lantibiotic biosynthesis protein LanM
MVVSPDEKLLNHPCFLNNEKLIDEKFKYLKTNKENYFKSIEKSYECKISSIIRGHLYKASSANRHFNSLEEVILNFFTPCFTEYAKRIQINLINSNLIQNKTVFFDNLSKTIINEIIEIAKKTFVLELNVFLYEEKNKIDSVGNYQRFFNHLIETKISFLNEYKQLFKLINNRLDYWSQNALEIFFHLNKDYKALCVFLNSEELSLINIKFLGDKHSFGKAVAMLEFDSNIKIMFKPRSLSVDEKFIELINYFNDSSINKIKYPKVLNRNGYGWMEYIPHKGCIDKSELITYYTQIGILQCILYILNAEDIHYDNIIAHGENPVLIDLECFFGTHYNEVILKDKLYSSICKTLLLPTKLTAGSKSIWIGGTNEIGGQETFIDNELINDKNQIIREPGVFDTANNIPFLLNNELIKFGDYKEFVKEGFSSTYDFILKNKKQILKYVSELSLYKNRFLARPTYTYKHLLNESYHPDYLKRNFDRMLHFDWLWNKASPNFIFNKLIKYEQSSLEIDVIPIFTYFPKERHLYIDSKIAIRNFFVKDGYTLVVDKIKLLNKKNKKPQLDLIDLSYDLFETETKNPTYISKNIANFNSSENLLQNIHNRLLGKIYFENDSIYAFDIADENNNRNIKSVSIDLYDGFSGIALYFFYFGVVKKDARSIKLSKQICQECFDRIKNLKEIEIGAFKGVAGIIYLISHIYSYSKSKELLIMAKEIIKLINAKIKQSEKELHFDVIFGISGSILSLASLYKVDKSKIVYDCIKKLAHILLSKVDISKNGLGWKYYTEVPLTGYSHGNSGTIHALLKAYEITKIERVKEIALEALKYERNHFDIKSSNWKDLRFADGDGRNGYNWCNGSMGIGLQRMELKKHIQDDLIDSEIETALTSTYNYGFGDNNCLCHGNFGNIELFLTYSLVNKNELKPKETLKKIKSHLFDNILKKGINSSTSFLPSLSFMTGEVGVLYQSLRLDFPELVPNILLLEEPN